MADKEVELVSRNVDGDDAPKDTPPSYDPPAQSNDAAEVKHQVDTTTGESDHPTGQNGSPASGEGAVEEEVHIRYDTGDDDEDDGTKEKPIMPEDQVAVSDLFRYATFDEKVLLAVGLVASILAGCAMPFFALILGEVMDKLNETQFMQSIIEMCIWFVILACGLLVFSYIQIATWLIAAERQAKRVRELYLIAVMRQEMAWHDLQATGTITVKLSTETRKYQDAIGDRFVQLVQYTCTFIAGIGVAMFKGWELSLILLAISPILAVVMGFMAMSMTNASEQEQKAYGRAGALANEVLSAIRTVFAFQAESRMLKLYTGDLETAYVNGIAKARSVAIGTCFTLATIFSFYGFTLWYGSYLIKNGKDMWPGKPYTGGSVIAILNAVITGVMSLGSASPAISALSVGRAAIKPIYETITRASSIDPLAGETEFGVDGQVNTMIAASSGTSATSAITDNTNKENNKEEQKEGENGNATTNGTSTAVNVGLPSVAGINYSDTKGKISFKNVTFRYPARPEVPVLDNLTLEFEQGKTVALVGESGCGKSTIIQLIERFYDPESGSVVIDDNYDLKSLNVASWRQSVGLVAQEPVLFNGSIKDNILYGCPDADDDAINKALANANATTFVKRLKNGIDTEVGDGGKLLSGGQKQRIAIARALVKNPPILLLDEATSALDNTSERVVQKALDELIKGPNARSRTTIIIAHRLSTIKDADRIVVLNRGKIIEDGTHDELLKLNGAYAALVRAQEAVDDTVEGKEQDGIGAAGASPSITAGSPLARNVSASAASVRSKTLSSRLPHSGSASASGRSVNGEDDDKFDEEDEEDPDEPAPEISVLGKQSRVNSKVVSKTKSKTSRGGAAPGEGNDGTPEGGEEGEVELDENDQPKKKRQLSVGLGRVWEESRPEWGYIIAGVIGALAEGAAYPLYAILLGQALNALYNPDTTKMMDQTSMDAIWFFLLGVGSGLAAFVRYYCLAVAGEALTRRIRSKVFGHLLTLDMAFHDQPDNNAGILVAKLATDATLVRNITADRMGQLANVIGNLGCGLIVSFSRPGGWRLALLMIALLPLMALTGMIQFSFMAGLGGKSKKVIERASALATESITHIRTVLSFNGEKAVIRMYSKALEPAVTVGTRSAHIAGLGVGVANSVMFLSYALVFYVGGYLVNKGDLNFEHMMQIFFALEMCAFMIGQAFQMAPDIDKAVAATNDIYHILDCKPSLNPNEENDKKPKIGSGEVELHNVYFHYPTRPDAPVLKGLSVKATGRKVLALVGESGCGKSTIIGLVQRFYDPVVPDYEAAALTQAMNDLDKVKTGMTPSIPSSTLASNNPLAKVTDPGHVTIDGVDIKDIATSYLRKHVGVVSQEPTLFSGTVAENIAFGCPDGLSQEEIEHAAKLANIHDLVMTRFPEKYNTKVGARGLQVSGGQKQRIAIARAIARQPSVLLLDEATSALDSTSERLVQLALTKAMKNRTTIVIAHRLSTIKDADAIAVVADGRVVEGPLPHDKLLALNGAYARLVEAAEASGRDSLEAPKEDKVVDKNAKHKSPPIRTRVAK